MYIYIYIYVYIYVYTRHNTAPLCLLYKRAISPPFPAHLRTTLPATTDATWQASRTHVEAGSEVKREGREEKVTKFLTFSGQMLMNVSRHIELSCIPRQDRLIIGRYRASFPDEHRASSLVIQSELRYYDFSLLHSLTLSLSLSLSSSLVLVGERHHCTRWVNYSPACHLTKAPPEYCLECDLRLVLVEHAPGIIFPPHSRDRPTGSLRNPGRTVVLEESAVHFRGRIIVSGARRQAVKLAMHRRCWRSVSIEQFLIIYRSQCYEINFWFNWFKSGDFGRFQRSAISDPVPRFVN